MFPSAVLVLAGLIFDIVDQNHRSVPTRGRCDVADGAPTPR
jgi:hypothetical protein